MENNKLIREIVRMTIEEFKKSGLLKSNDEVAYSEMSVNLRSYYHGEKTHDITQALKKIESDPYFEIIPLYYQKNNTIERIAEEFGVEVSTITRNKKRLCLLLYNLIEN